MTLKISHVIPLVFVYSISIGLFLFTDVQSFAQNKQATDDNAANASSSVKKNRPSVKKNQRSAGKNRQPVRPTVFWPEGIKFDAAITSPKQHFGFDIGQRHLRHDQVVEYLKKIADESERIQLRQYGRTHGGRPLLLLTITGQANRENLASISKNHRDLCDPAKSDRVVIQDLPAVINMGYGVHGDESSATNTAPLVAYYLAAAQGPEIDSWLKNCVILLDPCLNPDGFDRFARWENTFRGRILNSDPAHAEHNQGWPPGRVNYYWFDLNRDWLPLVHPESKSRMRWYHRWKPNVVLDFHEMGTQSTFFFQPGIPQRTNPLTPRRNVELTAEIAKYHSKELDKRGELYMTQELFDDFYMGKGSTYPDLHGAIGILFEQGSARGQVQESTNGLVRFPDTIRNQFTTSLTSLRATSDMREKLNEYQRDFYKKSMQMAREHSSKCMAFRARGDRSRVQQFAATLLRHDIDCFWLTENMKIGDVRLQKNDTLVVPIEQPEFRFIRSLLDRPTNFEENIFYDVSAWTLPLAYNLESFEIAPVDTEKLQLARINQNQKRNLNISDDDFAYIIDWRDAKAATWLARLLRNKIKVKVATEPFTVQLDQRKRRFGYGSLIVSVGIQKSKRAQIRRILKNAAADGVTVMPIKTGMTIQGPDIGSNKMRVIDPPQVALIIGRGASTYECGEIWHAFDQRLQMPLSLIPANRLGNTDLNRYKTIIVTSGRYDSIQDKLVEWTKSGGTLIAIGRAAGTFEKLATATADMDGDNKQTDQSNNAKQENKNAGAAEKTNTAEKQPIQRPFADARNDRALQLISGSIMQTQVDRTHPLCYGITTEMLPVFRNHTQFLAPSKNAYQNPLVYTPEDTLMSGYASAENQAKFVGKASAVVHPVGSGRMILLSDNPNFRGFWNGSQRVFFNSVFFGSMANAAGGRRRVE